jgi:superfamily II DNA or RNA helicase
LSDLVLRDYQEKALGEILGLFRQGEKRVLLQMPTGAGKTAIFTWILKKCAELERNCVMTVRGRSLVDQAAYRLSLLGVDHSVFMSDDKRFDANKFVQVASIDTCIRRNKFPKATTVIVDEAHLACSESFKKFLSHYPDANWLSVTATPWHKDGLKHIASHVVYPITFRELIDKKYLVRFRYFVPNSFDASKINTSKGEFVDSASMIQIQKQGIYGHLINNYKKNCIGEKTFVFCINIEHAKIVVAAFAAEKIQSELVTADTSLSERNEILKRCMLVISVGTLTTGV